MRRPFRGGCWAPLSVVQYVASTHSRNNAQASLTRGAASGAEAQRQACSLPPQITQYHPPFFAVTEGDPASFLRETPHPRDHDARSKGELHSTGARWRDGPAFTLNGRQK